MLVVKREVLLMVQTLL